MKGRAILHSQARRRQAGRAVSKAIDAMFENSPDETKTRPRRTSTSVRQADGDIGLIVRWILFAVFFTLLLVVGNTMAQSVRERVPELAVLKTLGFTDGSVLGFVLAKRLRCACSAACSDYCWRRRWARWWRRAPAAVRAAARCVVWLIGIAAIVLMSIAVGLLPGLRARRLRIVDALAGR